MEEATNSADLIRNDIKQLRNKCGHVGGNQKCDLCGYIVLSREFYLFPCEHVFHADCLRKEMLKHLDNVEKSRVSDLLNQIQQLNQTGQAKKKQTMGSSEDEKVNVEFSKVEKLKDELDNYIASECIYCGEAMIKSIDAPFIVLDELEDIISWKI